MSSDLRFIVIYDPSSGQRGTGGIGELANCLMGCAYVIPAGLVYKKYKTKKTALHGCIAGSLSIGIAAAILNYYILLPMYEMFMPVSEIIAAFSSIMPFIRNKFDVCFYNVMPMNIVKGALISLLAIMIYKPLSPLLHGSSTPGITAHKISKREI